MSFPLMPAMHGGAGIPVVTFCGSGDNFPTSMGSLGADDPGRYLVITRSSGSATTDTVTVSVNGVAQTVWYPQVNGTVLSGAGGGTGYAQFVIAYLPTGTTATITATGSTGGKTAWYTVTGLLDPQPSNGGIDSGNPASCAVNMISEGIVFGTLWSTNDNNSFTWSSPMVRTVNDTSLGSSRGASMAYYAPTPGGTYTVSVSMGAGTIYMGAIVLR